MCIRSSSCKHGNFTELKASGCTIGGKLINLGATAPWSDVGDQLVTEEASAAEEPVVCLVEDGKAGIGWVEGRKAGIGWVEDGEAGIRWVEGG